MVLQSSFESRSAALQDGTQPPTGSAAQPPARHLAGARPIGFLLFHWHVIEHSRGAGLERQLGGDTAYTVATSALAASSWPWPAWMGDIADAGDPRGLADYSLAIARWHNVEGHMVFGMGDRGQPLGELRTY